MLDYHLQMLQQAGLIDIKDDALDLTDFGKNFMEAKSEKPVEAKKDLSGTPLVQVTEVRQLLPCIADASKFRIIARLQPQLGGSLKLLEPLFPRARYSEKIGALNYEHPAVQVVYTSLTCGIGINDESGLIVNDRGERVVNEWSYQYTVSDAIARSGSNCGWYITSGKEPYGGVQYGYKSAVAGKSKDPCATSIEGLAKKMGCDPATLQATYDRYCELVEKGVDEDFGKPAEFLHPIKGPKFVALRMHPCVTVTFGGLETDVSARVMKPDGSVIPHLYAAGEVAGTGMYGTQYPTCGTSIGSALFYGRIAGRAVTDQALL